MSVFNIGFVIFPQLTQLDFTGPLQVLARLPDAATHIVAKSTAPVPSDCGMSLVPTCTLWLLPDARPDLHTRRQRRCRRRAARSRDDRIRAPPSQRGEIRDLRVYRRLRAGRGGTFARSPGDDSLGLHRSPPSGRCHPREISGGEGGNLITAGGVTSGIDFGLSAAAELAGELVTQSIQLGIEYDPAPPFNAGHPDRAPEPAIAALSGRYEKMRDLFRASLTDQILA